MPYIYEFPRPSVTVDCVLFGYAVRQPLRVLLVQRGGPPFKGRWALPGGFVHMKESLEDAAKRELHEETGIAVKYLEQLYTFGDPARDPRGRVIDVAYYALVPFGEHNAPRAASDAKTAQWMPVREAEALKLAFDHRLVLQTARDRLAAKVRYAPIGFNLLPYDFALSDLQHLYETVTGREFDKRNFRRRIQAMGILKSTGLRRGASGPVAEHYRFDQGKYEQLASKGFSFEL